MKVMCGTDNHSKDFKAKKYKLDKHFLSKVKVIFMKWKMSYQGSYCSQLVVIILPEFLDKVNGR